MRRLQHLVLAAALACAACGGTTNTATAEATSSTTQESTGSPANDTAAVANTATPTTVDTPSTATDAVQTEGTQPSASGQAAPATGASHASSAYLPPAGDYVYDQTGRTETSGVTNTQDTVPPNSTDHVTITGALPAATMTVTTTQDGSDTVQETTVAVTDRDARLTRLTYRSSRNGIGYSVNPDPPAVLARFPYVVDDSWEVAWNDPVSGVSGVGTGTLTGHETVSVPAGTVDTVVITVAQRLRGTITGSLTVTTWIDPTTGIQVKQHLVTDLSDATGASHTDTTRLLRQSPT